MKIKIEKNEKILGLLKAVASKDKTTSYQAMEALAAFMGPTIQQVVNTAPTIQNLYRTMEYNSNGDASIPLDLYTDIKEDGLLKIWSQYENGGLSYSMPMPPTNELKFNDYELDTAIAFMKKFAAAGRLDIIAKSIERQAQEILIKQENNSALVLLQALAGAKSTIKGVDTPHILRANTAGNIVLADFLKLFTLTKRINAAWNQGTPGSSDKGLTDLLVSPEIVENLRGMAFNPVYRGTKTDIPATDDMRKELYTSAGELSFYDVTIHEMNEFGIGYKWNDLFKTLVGGASLDGAAFDNTTEQICVGLNMNKDFLIRPVAVDEESGEQIVTMPDDQFPARAGKAGFYSKLRESRIAIDDRPLVGLIA